jgi:glucose-6-phosphate isomerase
MDRLYDGRMRPTALATTLASEQLASRLWQLDTTVYASPEAPPGVHDGIRQRLGWLAAPDLMADRTDDIRDFGEAVRDDGLTDLCLLGMGGSSLAAEVLRDVPGPRASRCRLTVLDTTDERAIRAATDRIDLQHAFFVVASKSGTTIEVTALERHFRALMQDAADGDAGSHFAAITDPGTPLVDLAERYDYRKVFINPPDIGGRFSALSLFGLVPGGLLGLDLTGLVASARGMAEECRVDGDRNPGLALGAFMAASAAAGHDKLTLLLDPDLQPLGPWIEQLVAESTGKDGQGVLPIVSEPVGRPAEYGPDRAFVGVVTGDDPASSSLLTEFKRAGHPVFRIETTTEDLGAEFFRWEFATAVAGAAMGINPFDEPNVREAKQRTQAQLDIQRSRGAFQIDPPFERGRGYSRREVRPAPADEPRTGRFVALLDYLPQDPERLESFGRLRAALRRRAGTATTHGIGPRYLHSTGQYHKGGPNTGVFLLLTAADAGATPVPGTDYTFSTLKQAQALGDFEALAAAGRHVVHYHIDDPLSDYAEELDRVLKQFV